MGARRSLILATHIRGVGNQNLMVMARQYDQHPNAIIQVGEPCPRLQFVLRKSGSSRAIGLCNQNLLSSKNLLVAEHQSKERSIEQKRKHEPFTARPRGEPHMPSQQPRNIQIVIIADCPPRRPCSTVSIVTVIACCFRDITESLAMRLIQAAK